MTSKEIDEILKSPITQGAKGRFISIEQLEQIKNNLKESEQQLKVMTYDGKVYIPVKRQLTFDECVKEWEERGFTFKKRGLLVEIESKEWNVNIHIWMDDNELLISNYEENYYTIIPYDLVYLLSKTLKALEVENEKEN